MNLSIQKLTEDDNNTVVQQNIRNRCGEIFFEQNKLQYYCLFCQENFGKISKFQNHLYRLHLFMDTPLIEDENSKLVDNGLVKIDVDDIKYDATKSYQIDNLKENNGLFCIVENNEEHKFIPTPTYDIKNNKTINNYKRANDLCGSPKNENILNECKIEILDNEINGEDTEKKNQCKICLKILSSDRSLKRHNLTHQDVKQKYVTQRKFPRGEDNKFHCNQCTNAYLRIDSLGRHIKKIHLGYSNHVKCSVCLKILASKVTLKGHMRLHTGEKPYKCDHCLAAFADRTNFDRHLRIHLGDKRYKCNYCDKTFFQRIDKISHERMVHTKERLYQCEICGSKFYNSVNLNEHKKRHTNTRPSKCEICGKRFYNGKLLKSHKISHSKEKPHECDICNAKFPRRKALVQHVKIHSNVKGYVCIICNKAFAQSSGLYSHMKAHSGNPQTMNNVNSHIDL